MNHSTIHPLTILLLFNHNTPNGRNHTPAGPANRSPPQDKDGRIPFYHLLPAVGMESSNHQAHY